jgi:hypothetical protein
MSASLTRLSKRKLELMDLDPYANYCKGCGYPLDDDGKCPHAVAGTLHGTVRALSKGFQATVIGASTLLLLLGACH